MLQKTRVMMVRDSFTPSIKIFLCISLSQRKLSNKRGPPLFQNQRQKNGNASDTVQEKVGESKKEGDEQGVIRWVSFVFVQLYKTVSFFYYVIVVV